MECTHRLKIDTMRQFISAWEIKPRMIQLK